MSRMNFSHFESLTRLKSQILPAPCSSSPVLGHCSPCRRKARLVLALGAGMEGGALETLRRVGGEKREEEREEGEEEISQGGEEGSSRHRLPAPGLGLQRPVSRPLGSPGLPPATPRGTRPVWHSVAMALSTPPGHRGTVHWPVSTQPSQGLLSLVTPLLVLTCAELLRWQRALTCSHPRSQSRMK